MGGSFNPVHLGHLRIAEEMMDALNQHKLSLLPNSMPPHKRAAGVSTEHRLAMLALAIEGNSRLGVDLREVQRDGLSYMVDTLAELRDELGPETPIVLGLGSDSFASLTQWREPQRILQLANLLVLARPGWVFPKVDLAFKIAPNPAQLTESPAGLVGQLAVTQLDISSSAIRRAAKAQRSVRYLAPKSVCDYLLTNKLYQA